jgi:hypothetical protein
LRRSRAPYPKTVKHPRLSTIGLSAIDNRAIGYCDWAIGYRLSRSGYRPLRSSDRPFAIGSSGYRPSRLLRAPRASSRGAFERSGYCDRAIDDRAIDRAIDCARSRRAIARSGPSASTPDRAQSQAAVAPDSPSLTARQPDSPIAR